MSFCLIENNTTNSNSLLSSEELDAEQKSVATSTVRRNSSSAMEMTSSLALNFRALSQLDVSLSLVGKPIGMGSHSGTGNSPEKTVSTTLGEPKKKRQVEVPSTGASLKIVALDEVAWHDTADDCWIVVYDYVYDVTGFLDAHPGGQDVLLEYAGRDATLAFVGSGHSRAARRILDKYLVGELPPSERIFRTSNGIKIGDFV